MTAIPPQSQPTTAGLGTNLHAAEIVTGLILSVGGSLLVATYGTILPIVFLLILASPIVLYLFLRTSGGYSELRIFVRSLSVGMLAAGIASYYANVLLDPYQLGSDAWSFYDLSSHPGPARSLQDLQTITEGAGAVVLWQWFYDVGAFLGFPRDPYVGISVNIVMVAVAAVVCSRSARYLYGEDDYRLSRLVLFFTVAGNLWLFAGLHIRDSSIFLIVVILTHFWIAYLAELKSPKIALAIGATLLAMPALAVLRKEFFYIPLLIGLTGLVCLNFSSGRGDRRFITLVSLVAGLLLVAVALAAYGSEIRDLLLTNQQSYSEASTGESRAGSLGSALIVEQPLLIRIAIGVPYLLYFPIPFWVGINGESAYGLFKSLNALSFYFVSAFVLAGGFSILSNPRLRSPAFLFVLVLPFAVSVIIALTSLETRHLASFITLFFLVGLMPDLRGRRDQGLLRFCLLLTCGSMLLVHAAWFAVRNL